MSRSRLQVVPTEAGRRAGADKVGPFQMSAQRVISLLMVGRFGNQVMQYLWARAHAERTDSVLWCEPWLGDEVFQLPSRNYVNQRWRGYLPRRDTATLLRDETNVELRCYAQNQSAAIYTVEQARRWLRFRIFKERILSDKNAAIEAERDRVVGHVRRGDYAGYGYPLVSLQSYVDCVEQNGLNRRELTPTILRLLTEDSPTPYGVLPDRLSWLPDFWRLAHAPVLLRANSTFSWVAGLLNPGEVWSPVIDGLEGGKEHDCRFVLGNHPKLVDREGFTDMHISP